MTAGELRTISTRLKSPFLAGLAPDELRHVLTAARQCRYSAGSVVSTQGTPANSMYLLAEGRARFFILTPEGKKILLLWLPEGEIFGGAALERRSSDYIVSTETVKDSLILVWEKPVIRLLAIRYPRLFENALATATEYLTFYVATHVALTCNTAPQRLAAVLTNLAHGIGHALPQGIELDVTNEELAQTANVTTFTASRLISSWQKKGALRKTRGKVVLLSPGKLLLPAA